MTRDGKHSFANKHNNLMDKVVENRNIKSAFERVIKNKGAPGIDQMTTDELGKHLKQNWKVLKDQLLNGTYEPQPVRRVEIPKPDGGVRELGIPTVLDRFIQQAIQQILTPIWEPIFSDHSYGFRPGRSAQQAVNKAKSYVKDGYSIVVDLDLEKFFDRINHDIIMSKIMERISDKRIHKLIRKYLKAGVLINGVRVSSEEGAPQGGPLSPILSNILLDDLDKELTKRGHRFVRYADDCNTYVKTKRAGKRVYDSINKFIGKKLRLRVNEQKSAVDKTSRRKFLSFTLLVQSEIKIGIAKKAIDKFKAQIRFLTNKNMSLSIESRIEKLNLYLIGWTNYFRLADTRSIFERLNGWIKRRLRVCLLKQWKQCKTKLKNLVQLGLTENWAGRIAYSRKKYWRLSQTQQIHKALGNKYWKSMGLDDMVERYDKLRMPL